VPHPQQIFTCFNIAPIDEIKPFLSNWACHDIAIQYGSSIRDESTYWNLCQAPCILLLEEAWLSRHLVSFCWEKIDCIWLGSSSNNGMKTWWDDETKTSYQIEHAMTLQSNMGLAYGMNLLIGIFVRHLLRLHVSTSHQSMRLNPSYQIEHAMTLQSNMGLAYGMNLLIGIFVRHLASSRKRIEGAWQRFRISRFVPYARPILDCNVKACSIW
jgi:hypothetical protein